MVRTVLSCLVLSLSAPVALAGDPSGFDPDAITQCLSAAATQGARADCANAGMAACLDYAATKYSGDDPDFPMSHCVDAAHQSWEVVLTATYKTALQAEAAKGIKPQEMLRQTERSWIAFRDDLCHQARDSAGMAKGDLAYLRCLRNETARQVALLMSIGANE